MPLHGGILRRNHYALKLIHICCWPIQGHNNIRFTAFSKPSTNFAEEILRNQKKDGDSDTSLCLHKTSRFDFMQIWDSCQIDVFFFNLLIIFHFIKIKQSCYYFFFMKVFTFVSMLAYTSGFKCQRPNISSFAIARPTRERVHQYVVYRNEDL